MSLRRRIAFNSLIQFAGKIVTLGLSLVLAAFLTRQLGVATYGDYVAVLTYSQFFAIAADMGLNVYVLKRLSTPHEGERQLLGSAFGIRLVSLAGLLFLAGGAAWFLPSDSIFRWALLAALISSAIQVINMLFVTVLQARLEMRYAVASEIVGRAVTLGGSLVAIFSGGGLVGVVMAQVAGSLTNLLFTCLFSRRFVTVERTWQPARWGAMLRESLPISVSTVLSYAYFKTDVIILSLIPIIGRDNNIETGIYGAAYKILEVLLLIPAVFLGSVFPVLSDFINRNDGRIQQLMDRASTAMFFLGTAVGWFLFLFAPQVIQVVAGAEYEAAVLPLRILGLATALNFFATVYTYVSLAFNRQKLLIWLYGSAAVFNIGLNLWLIPQYSYLAAAWVTVGTEVIILAGALAIALGTKRFTLPWGTIVRHVAYLSGIAALCWWVTLEAGSLAGLAIFAVLVVLSAQRLQIVTLQDLRRGGGVMPVASD